MNFSILDPNIAYLFLASFFFLAGIAILTPGTGLLEVGAIVALILAGWGVYTLPINTWALIILILGVIPFIIAVRISTKIYFLAVSIGSLVIGSLFLFRSDTWWKPAIHPLLGLVVSGIVGGFYWLVTVRVLQAEAAPPSHDLGRLIGEEGEVKSEIKEGEEGSVQVLGELWTARSSTPLEEGAVIKVVDRMGFVLEVEPLEED
ncbi:MAG: NfeD family protein [Anaerolineales bacterium]